MSSHAESGTGSRTGARKSRRNPRACDTCSRKSVRCQAAVNDPLTCQNCVDFGENCTFDRPLRRRGQPRKAVCSIPAPPLRPSGLTGRTPQLDANEWKPKLPIQQALVMDLTDIFFEVVYPVFPLFHRASLLRKVSRGEHLHSRPLNASVMAMCALASARARDGALLHQSWDVDTLQNPASERFFEAALDSIPEDLLAHQSLDYMRASVLLSITAIQYGSPSLMSYHLSRYKTYVAIGSLHDESYWPQGLSVIEVEERRRLFWSAYTLDVFTSVVWGGVIGSREAASNVFYPAESDDESLEEHTNAPESDSVSWIRGWNYVTDMYRMLEYGASDLQQSRSAVRRTPVIPSLRENSSPSHLAVLDRVTAMYDGLPHIFKHTAEPTSNSRQNLYSFQAANIAATMQLVRMVYFSSDTSTLEQKCRVASEVLDAFAEMPVAYLRAISSPLLHHLAEIGRIFGAAFGAGMRASLYHSVRSVLLDLATLLANLETKLFFPTEASKKVEAQLDRIDQFIHEQHHASTEGSGITQIEGVNVPQGSDSALHTWTGTTSEQQSPEIMFPPELFDDWSWAFNFT